MIAHLATLRGLRDVILKDTFLEAEVYRNELDDTAKGLEDFINRLHLLLYSIEVKPLDK